MARHTTFRFCLDPTVEQREVLARHAGAARFAFNQCLRMVKTGLSQRETDPDTDVPWTGSDLINAFNAWKKGDDSGRALAAWSDSRSGKRIGKRVGFPRFEKKNRCGAVIPAAQQPPQGPRADDPGRG